MKPCILFVDDEPNVLKSLERMLRHYSSRWNLLFFEDSQAAWERVQAGGVDAVVTDLKMPGIDGFQLIARIRTTPAISDLPIVMLTGLGDRTLKRQALELGASDLLNKPVEEADLLARLESVLRLKAFQDELKSQNEVLERRVQERTRELAASRVAIIWRLGKIAEFRDQETGNHIARVACYSRVLARALRLDDPFTEQLFLTAPLHDIGKIAIPDSILLKPGKLTPDEWGVMQSHCEIGARILREDAQLAEAFRAYGFEAQTWQQEVGNPLLNLAAEIALTHHERWDGTGYPHRLAGDTIPLSARLVAVADVFDALTSERPYKRAFEPEKAAELIREGRASHFDPQVCDAFESSFNEFKGVYEKLQDTLPMLDLQASLV